MAAPSRSASTPERRKFMGAMRQDIDADPSSFTSVGRLEDGAGIQVAAAKAPGQSADAPPAIRTRLLLIVAFFVLVARFAPADRTKTIWEASPVGKPALFETSKFDESDMPSVRRAGVRSSDPRGDRGSTRRLPETLRRFAGRRGRRPHAGPLTLCHLPGQTGQ